MIIQTNEQAIDRFLDRARENVYPSRDAFKKKLMLGERISAYVGVDPTGPSLHLGHAIELRKLAELQKLGHKIILLIGDFTAMIGDPTDKMATRTKLTRGEVLVNCQSYRKQAEKILAFDGENAVEMRFNSDWLAQMSFSDVVELSSHFTVQQMMERDMFEKRIEEGKPVHLHEFLYPLMQGYDSVAMEVDLEVGGNDQTFNMLAGRTLLREMKQKEKFVLTCKLLTDPSGKKMGKSEGNMITLSDTPEDMYGKVMSWTDGMILSGFELCTDVSDEDIALMKHGMEAGENPVLYKHRLAREIVRTFVGETAAEQAAEHFAKVHQAGETPEEIGEMIVETAEMSLVDALVLGKLVSSKTDARRQIEQGAVKVDEAIVQDVAAIVHVPVTLQKGKRHFIRLTKSSSL